jgi:hypothetical protein
MNQFQESLAELRRTADRIATAFLQLAPGPIHENRIRTRPELKAVIRVLRCGILGDMPAPDDIALLNRAIKVQSFSLTAERRKDAVMLGLWGQLWVLTYHISYYLNCLAENPVLNKYAPIGVCAVCDAIFQKGRSDQIFCGPGCRMKSFAAQKGNQYFADKARRNRAAKKALSHGPKNRPKR